MATALQLPYVRQPAAPAGGRVFRKQILPFATVRHPRHGNLAFTRSRLQQLVDRFKAGAYDMVPFLLADSQNRHHDDMRLARGTVKDLELGDDGLYARIEATDDGARLLSQFPTLPVSVRIARDRSGAEALAHVLGTPDPVAKGLRGWEPIEASSRGMEVIDMSTGEFVAQQPDLVLLDGETREPVELSNTERQSQGGIVWRDGLPYESTRPPVELSNTEAAERDEALDLARRLGEYGRRTPTTTVMEV